MIIKKNDKSEKPVFDLVQKTKSAIINAADQNSDGELNLDDVAHLADNISSSAKKAATMLGESAKGTATQMVEKQVLKKQERDAQNLRPIFVEDLKDEEFRLPNLIRIVGADKKHTVSKACEGAIGDRAKYKDTEVANIYPSAVNTFGISFYPDANGGVYYVNPCDRNHYIALNEYFNFLKVARIAELQRLAQDLGAKHFRVTYKEQKKTMSSKKISTSLDAKPPKGLLKIKASGKAHSEIESKGYEKIEIAAEMDCKGRAPKEPTLVYLKNDESIKSLIAMRMSNNKIKYQILTLNLSQSSGIRTSQAADIEVALKMMNCKEKTSILKEAKNEERRVFQYEIYF